MAGFDKLISKCLLFLVLLICQLILTEAVSVEPMCSKFSYDEQLLEKMVRMEFFVENVQKDSEKSVSNVMDMIHDIQGNNSELSYRLSEQQEKVDSLERQTDILNDTMANKVVVSENTESIRSMAADVRNIRNDLENNTSGLDNLKVITEEINKKLEDGLSDMSKILEKQTNVLSDTMANKSIVSANTKSMESMALKVENIKKDLEKSTSGLDDLKAVTDEVKTTCKDDLSELSKKFAALEKQIIGLDQATKTKTQTVAFNVLDAVSYTGTSAIKFSNIKLNEGNAYDKETGIFTSPIDGIYQFNAHICGNKNQMDIEYFIIVGTSPIVTGEFTLPSRVTSDTDTKCTSFSAVAMVRKGEAVRVGGMSFTSLGRVSGSDLSSFSGVLIKTLI